jgi:nucleotidyltransferase substrate binding protein (TIGR01987 family)
MSKEGKRLMANDIRWQQRFQNFSKALNLLRSVFNERNFDELNQLEQEGAVQRFEYTWELAWKTLKDYLEYKGIVLIDTTPRQIIKEAASCGIFHEATVDGAVFMEMLEARNELSHTYDFEKFKVLLKKIQNQYWRQFENLYDFFVTKRLESE